MSIISFFLYYALLLSLPVMYSYSFTYVLSPIVNIIITWKLEAV